jgi:iron complex outermembrane receptor protein
VKNITITRSVLIAGVALAAMGWAMPAAAQDAAGSGSAAPAADAAAGQLGDIIVTAERRAENLQKVPLSVAALKGDDLRTYNAGGDDTLLSLSGRVPGLYAETTTGKIFPRFYIRGLGNIDFYLGASQPVEIIQDDVVLEHVVLKSNPVFDVAQVEVLRGPQGTLFGRNTTAGIIKFDTNKPTQEWDARADASVGSYATATLDAGVGGPIIKDLLAFRVSTLIQHRDNWVSNVYRGTSADGTITPAGEALGGYDDRNVRLQLLFTPTDRLTIEGSAHARIYTGTSTLFHRAGLVKGSNDVSAEPRTVVAYDEAANNPQGYDTYGTSLKVGYDLGLATLTSISAWETTEGFSRGDTDGGAAANFPVNGVPNGFGQSQGNVRSLNQYTQELRLASNGTGRFKWQVGGLYFDSRDTTDFYQRAFFLTTAARNPNQYVRLRNANTSWGVFGQASYEILPKLTLTGGVRVTEDTKETRLVQSVHSAAGVDLYPAANRRYVKLSDTQPSWDVSLGYQVNPDVNVYARVARGFRGPTIQGRSAVFNSDFTTANSETILSYEAGLKTNLFDRHLRFNASGFYYEVSNIQLNGNDSNGNGVLLNASKAKAYGLESDVNWRPSSRLSIGAGLSLLHSEISDRNVLAQVCALNGAVVCTVLNPTTQIRGVTFAQINGNPLPNAPEYNVNLTGRYDLPLANGGKVYLATDWNLQGYTSFVLYKTKEFSSNGNFEGGLKLGYVLPGDKIEVALFGRNITNEKNLKGVIENYLAAVFNDPRILGVSLSAKLR